MSETTEQDIQTALRDYRSFKMQIQQERPFLLTLAFINELNAKRAHIKALLSRVEDDKSFQFSFYHTYFNNKEAALKQKIYELFRDGHIRVTAETMRLPGMIDILMPKEKGGSAEF